MPEARKPIAGKTIAPRPEERQLHQSSLYFNHEGATMKKAKSPVSKPKTMGDLMGKKMPKMAPMKAPAAAKKASPMKMGKFKKAY